MSRTGSVSKRKNGNRYVLFLEHRYAVAHSLRAQTAATAIFVRQSDAECFFGVNQAILTTCKWTRGRARVSVSASAADWPKRIRDMQYVDHDDFAVAH